MMCLYGMFKCELCCELLLLLLLNMAHMDCLVCERLWSKQC